MADVVFKVHDDSDAEGRCSVSIDNAWITQTINEWINGEQMKDGYVELKDDNDD